MSECIDYINLMDVAKMNLNNCINDTINLYKEKHTPEIKMQLINLIYDRKKLFLFDKKIIKKYL